MNTCNCDVVREADSSDVVIDDTCVHSTIFRGHVIQLQCPRDLARGCVGQDGVILVPDNFRCRRAAGLTAETRRVTDD